MKKENKRISCIENGLTKEAKIELTEDIESVKIKFILEKRIIEKEDETFFGALIKVREELEKINIKLLCKGCCTNVYPSGMLLSMGTGRTAYSLTYGEQAKNNSLVDIFSPCLIEDYGTIKQQAEFFESWVESIGK